MSGEKKEVEDSSFLDSIDEIDPPKDGDHANDNFDSEVGKKKSKERLADVLVNEKNHLNCIKLVSSALKNSE